MGDPAVSPKMENTIRLLFSEADPEVHIRARLLKIKMSIAIVSAQQSWKMGVVSLGFGARRHLGPWIYH